DASPWGGAEVATLKAELRDVMGDWKAAEVDLTAHIRYNVEKNVMEAFDIPA
ncbi:hypothetical protein CALCODRAFT_488994, partial [Calocera cornea HHB12733]